MIPKSFLKIAVIQTTLLFGIFMMVGVDTVSAQRGGPGGGGPRMGGGPGGGGPGGGPGGGGPRMGGPPPGGFNRVGPAGGGGFSYGRGGPGGPPGRPGGPGGPGFAGPPGGPGRPFPPGVPGRPFPPRPPGGPGPHWDRWGPPPGYAVGAIIGGAIAAFAIGTMFSTTEFYALPCAPTTLEVQGVTYYLCGDNWYIRGYSGGNIVYVVVDPPPGY
jgi:hypothetical protein